MSSTDRVRVLLVDDERVILDLVERFICRLDVDVDCVENGEAALALMQRNFYHLFIIDLLMPGMNGIQLLQRVNEASPDSEVIILTGYGDMQSVIEALRGGAYDYFQKPIEDADVFLMAVQRALDKQRLTVERRRLVVDLQAAYERIEEQRVQELQHIQEIGAALASSLQRDEIIRALHTALSARTGAEVVGFCLTGPAFDAKEWLIHTDRPVDDTIPLELKSFVDEKLSQMGIVDSLDDEVVTRVLVDECDPETVTLTGPLRSSIVVPMVSRDQLQGLVTIASRSEDAFSEHGERLLSIFAGQAVIALENEAMFRRMANLAIRDGLTGLINHRHFYELLQVEIERSERYSHQFSLLMIDADSLKNTNDTYGHLAGDQVLRELAGLLLQETRESDMVARYGGDEFTVILPESPIDRAEALAQRLRWLVEEHKFMCGDERIEFTISVGVTSFVPGQRTTVEGLVGCADRSLYEAKAKGGNRVGVIHPE